MLDRIEQWRHGIFAPTPSGPPTPAHFLVAWFNTAVVKKWEGTLVVLIEDEYALLARPKLSEPIGIGPNPEQPAVRYWGERMLAELAALDIKASSSDELATHGFRFTDGVVWTSESPNRPIVELCYKQLGYEAEWGEWPPNTNSYYCPIRGHSVPHGSNIDAINVGKPARGILHPHIILAWAVEEMSMRRTFAIDGADLYVAGGQFYETAHKVSGLFGWQIPAHLFIPVIYRQTGDERRPLVALSSSDLENRIFLSDVIKAGISGEMLLEYMLRIVAWPGRIDSLRDVNAQYTPAEMIDWFKPHPIINEESWFRFLETGRIGD